MGVPKFFYWITRRYPCVYQKVNQGNIPSFDYFYVDLNSIIHQCSHGPQSTAKTNQERFKDITASIDKLCRFVKPRRLLFLAVDGVAPFAKITQQRQRRFTKIRDQLKSGVSNESFDSNCISPGTEFMIQLDEYISNYLTHKISDDYMWQKFQVYYSGVRVPGEGEHKIMEFIRNCSDAPRDGFIDGTHLIHGNDADLIFLGLCLKPQKICVLKEVDPFFNGQSYDRIIIYHTLLRNYIHEEFSILANRLKFEFDIDSIIKDWVLMGFLVGNDFLPTLPFLYIKTNSLALLWTAYKKVLPTLDGYLVEDFSINLKRFKIFLAHLSNYEIKHFRDSQANEVWLSGKKNRKTTSIHQHSTSFIYSANDDLNQVIHEDVSIDINIGNDEIFTPSTFGPSFQSTTPDLFDQDDQEIAEISEHEKTQFESFKGDYYKSKLKNHFDTYANDICMEYIRGLEWTIRYYFKGTPSWMWLFPYHYAPFASDLANNMPDSIEFDLGEPCSPFVQLACIMPKESFNLLPRKIQTFFDNPNHQLIDMFPTEFESDKLGKAQEYESVVLIPFPDISRIKPIVEEIMLESDQTSSNVNSFGDSFLYEYVPEISSTLMLPPDESQQDSHVNVLKLERLEIIKPKQVIEKFPSTPHPSFAPLPHDTTLRVFNINNSLQISAETVINQPKPVELNVMKLITYPFCGNYPFSNLYFSTEFYDLEYRYRIRKRSRNHELVCRIEREKLTQDEISNIMEICQDYQQRYYNDYRITIPKISYLINVKPFVGFKYSMAARNCSVKYVWSEESLFMPFEICYPIDPKFRLSSAPKLDVKQIYQPGDLVLSTDSENFGFISKIKSIDVGSSTAEIEMCCEPHFDLSNVGFIQKSMYYSFYDSITSCKMLGINKMVFGRVAGSILVRKHHEGRVFADIGLKLKSKSFDMEVIGYTKISNNYYFFSEEALLLIKEYLTRFTHLYTLLVHFPVGCDSITLELLESGQDDCLLDTIQTWLADNKVGKLVRVFGGCHYIDTPSTQELLTLPKKVKTYKTITQPLKDLISLNPIFTSTHLATDPKNLLDFVICTHLDDTSPYLQTGIVTGVFSTYGPQSMPIYYCEVMFMEENSVGTLHRGGSSRLACVPSDSIINISSRRSNFPKFVPNKWKHTLFTGNFTPSMEFKNIFRIKTTFIPSDISLEPSHQFEQLIKNLSFHRETVPTRISQQNVEINVHTNSEILIRLLEDLCQSMVDSELSFAMKKFQHKHLCVVNVGKRSFYGSWSSTEEMAKLNSCYVAYYSLLSQIDNPQPDYQR